VPVSRQICVPGSDAEPLRNSLIRRDNSIQKLDWRYRGMLWIRRSKVRNLPPQPLNTGVKKLSTHRLTTYRTIRVRTAVSDAILPRLSMIRRNDECCDPRVNDPNFQRESSRSSAEPMSRSPLIGASTASRCSALVAERRRRCTPSSRPSPRDLCSLLTSSARSLRT
jgi:hypothetical protein